MATAKVVSPGAALLRASRMFSIPAPISAPSDLSVATKHKSDTATTPFPTHLTVTTPETSRMVGDWGFKRPFPLKTTTKSTTPLARVRKVDSIEHVTDFQSASDHTITLKKFQELNMSVTVPTEQNVPNLKSVFEDDTDITALSPEEMIKQENTRWRFNGPWLAGMTDGQFNEYLTKSVRGKRAEFREYLKKDLAAALTIEATKQAQEKAEEAPAAVVASDITDEAFTEHLRLLRHDPVQLHQHVSRFLDLAPLSPEDTTLMSLGKFKVNKPYKISSSPYAANGPPITHPSAGISYLRTDRFLENHPVYGPQYQHAPVQARIVKPRNSSSGYVARLGLGGFITKIPEGEAAFNQRNMGRNREAIPGLDNFHPDVDGGSKVYVNAHKTTVDSTGKIMLEVRAADPVAVTVQKELVGEGVVYQDAVKERTRQNFVERPREQRQLMQRRRHMSGSRESYGLGE